MKIIRKITRSATTGRTLVSVTAVDDAGTRSTWAQHCTQSRIAETRALAEREAVDNLNLFNQPTLEA